MSRLRKVERAVERAEARERGTGMGYGKREQGMGSGNGETGMGNMERGTGNRQMAAAFKVRSFDVLEGEEW